MANEKEDPGSAAGILAATSEVLTEHDKALIDAGRRILVESLDSGREYCKHMIAIASGAIAAYLALLEVGRPESYVPNPTEYLFWVFPAGLFLLSLLTFSFGLLPGFYQINLNNFSSINDVRSKVIRRRQLWSLTGLSFLALGVFVGTLVLFVGPV